jgi:L-alanine-DL-glutamate epimerase-like enolase superfamily enzyme
MKLVNFNIMEISIPFQSEFKHSLASRKASNSVIFEIIADNGKNGFGEGAPREYVTGESIISTIRTLQTVSEKLKNKSINLSINAIDIIIEIQNQLADILEFSPSAKCAFELALLDLIGKTLSKPVVSFFGDHKAVDILYSGVISDNKSSEIFKILNLIKLSCVKQVKIKAGNDFNANSEKIKLIKSYLDDDIEFRIDVNGAWNLRESLRNIEFYNKYDINIFEQPMGIELKNDYPYLLKNVDDNNKIIVDESICKIDDAIWFIDNKGANGINLKISKHGGLLDTFLIHNLSSDNGFVNQIGCHVGETSILTSANVVFSSLSEDLFAYEGAYGNFLLKFDLIMDPIQFDKNVSLSTEILNGKIGLGIEVDSKLLNLACVSKYHY